MLDVVRARRISISEMARLLEVSRPQLSNALSGKRPARLGYWLAVGQVLDLTSEEVRSRLVETSAPRGLNTFLTARTNRQELGEQDPG